MKSLVQSPHRQHAFALISILFLGACSNAIALSLGPYSEAYVFGDSISDNGNVALSISDREVFPYADLATSFLVPAAPYDVSDRFSNGPVWSDMVGLAPWLGGGTNYAFGGAESGPLGPVPPDGDITILEQVGFYTSTSGGVASPDALYVVAPIGNDLRRAAEAYLAVWLPTGDASAAGALATSVLMEAVNNVDTITRQLELIGAEHFLISNGADIGLTPSIRLSDDAVDLIRPTDLASIVTSLATDYTSMLASRLDDLVIELAVDIKQLDVFGLINGIVADPGSYGLANVTDPCINPGVDVCADPDSYLFWDGIHLTTAGQAILADAIQAAVPSPTTLALLILGLGGFVIRHRTRSLS